MGVENLQNKKNLADRQDTVNAILAGMREQKNRNEDPVTLAEVGKIKELQKKEKISIKKNGAQKKESEVNPKEERLPRRPEAARLGNEEAVEKTQTVDKPEWQEKMAEMINPGDVVLPLWESDEAFDKEEFWVLEEKIKEDDGEEILCLVLLDKEGEKVSESDFGRGWEHITPYYEDEESYVNKLKAIREALEQAEEDGDEYRVDKLADLLKQVYIFAAEFIEKNSK